MKSVALEPEPAALVTMILPEVAAAGTVARSCVSESTMKVPETPLNVTEVVPVNLLPVSVTWLPTGALAGLNEVIDGLLPESRAW